MTQVVVSVRYIQNQSIDLQLPLDINSQVLAKAVAQALGLSPEAPGKSYRFGVLNQDKSAVISVNQTLLDAGVMYGDSLDLLPGTIVIPHPTHSRTEPVQTETKVKGFLSFGDGKVVTLCYGITRIGRFAPNNEVEIDLTPYDSHKQVSRKHAILSYQEGTFILKDTGSGNGSLLDNQLISPGEDYPLADGQFIVFGGKFGVRTQFIQKLESQVIKK